MLASRGAGPPLALESGSWLLTRGRRPLLRCWAQVHEATIAAGAYPSPYNYFNYPK